MPRSTQTNENGKFTANLQRVKKSNSNLIFSLIYRLGPMSRAALTAKTKLSPTTVSSLVEELISGSLITEIGTPERKASGRKAQLLSVVPQGRFFLSAELTREGFEVGLFNLLGKETANIQERVLNYGIIGELLILAAEILMSKNQVSESRLGGFCIGAPALINPMRQMIVQSTVLPPAAVIDFMPQLRKRFPCVPIRLENESVLRGYAEIGSGEVTGEKDLLYIDVGTGIGSGLVLGGRPYRGAYGTAGEIGHISIDINGPVCSCGNRGCLECMANLPALVELVVRKLESGQESTIHEEVGGEFDRVDVQVIRNAAELGDLVALDAIDEIARRLASGINSAINLLDPKTVIISGKMTELGSPLIDRIGTHIQRIALASGPVARQVRLSKIEGNASTLGGAHLMLDEFLKRPKLGYSNEEELGRKDEESRC